MNNSVAVVGIDISKDWCDLHLGVQAGKRFAKRIKNTAEGWREADAWICEQLGDPQARVHCCLEATGIYGLGLARLLHERGHRVSIINPARVTAFRESEGFRGKNDKQDALLLARFCQQKQPRLWTPPTAEQEALRELVERWEDLEGMIVQERNRLQTGRWSPGLQAQIQHHLEHLEEQEKALEAQLWAWVKEHEEVKRQVKLLESIPGIARKTAVRLLAVLGDIRRFESARSLAAFAGVTPKEKQSGSSVNGPAQMSRKGLACLRKWLYFPAITSQRCSPPMRAWKEQLEARGKTSKQIIVAGMRKLLHIIYGVITSQRPYDAMVAFPQSLQLVPVTQQAA